MDKRIQQLELENHSLHTSNQELEAEVARLKEIVEQAEELNREHVELKNETWLLREQVRIKDEQLQAMPTTTLADYEAVRSHILKNMTIGKGSAASTSPQYKFANRALGKFIEAISRELPGE